MQYPIGRLPPQPTPLIGRDDVIVDVRRRLCQPEVRLLTLTGAAGSGKTRLAVAVASELQARFAQGVWFVDLSPIAEPALVLPTIAQALGIAERAAEALEATLIARVADRSLLVVLDNCEQVLGAAPQLATFLSHCPSLRVLATSREPLRLSWEHEVPVPPLGVPRDGEPRDAASVAASAAVMLYVQRAQALRPEFRLTDANAQTVAELCVRLDGLPLALELAAARSRSLPPEAILARVEERLSLLGGGPRDWPARHRGLRAAIGWSYDQLPASEQRVFRRLGTFVGGFTLEAAARVVGDATPGEVIEAVASLVEKSLVRRRDDTAGEARFDLLETMRLYALEQLAASDDLDAVRRRHCLYFLELAESAQSAWWGPKQASWLERLAADYHNLRAALQWSSEHRDAASVELRMAAALWRFWSERGHLAEGRFWLAQALQGNADAPSGLRAAALNGAGNLDRAAGAFDVAEVHYAEALACYRSLGDERAAARVLSNRGNLAYDQGDLPRARELFEESLAIREELGDERGVAMALTKLGNVARGLGDVSTARRLHERHLSLARRLEDAWGIAQALDDLGLVALADDAFAAARPLHTESLARFQALGDTWGAAHALYSLGRVALAEGKAAEADRLLRQSLQSFYDLGDVYDVALVLGALGSAELARGDAARAAFLLEAATALRENAGCALPPVDRSAFDDALRRVRAAVKDTSSAIRLQARSASLEQTVQRALEVPPVGPKTEADQLTRRERDVVVLVARGLSNQQVAEALIIGERTVETHVSNAMRKLDLPSRTRLASWATQQGLV